MLPLLLLGNRHDAHFMFGYQGNFLGNQDDVQDH